MTKKFLLFFLGLLLVGFGQAQQLTIELGNNEIAQNQAFTITLSIHNSNAQRYSGFPDIDGFVKQGNPAKYSSTYNINGQVSSTLSVTQSYYATQEGTYTLPPFQIQVDDQTVSSKGTTIKVGPPQQRQQRRRFDPFGDPFGDPFEDLYGRRNQPQEFLNIEADAFLALTSDKYEIYVGEGFTMTLALYVSESNKAEMSFYDLTKQLTEIVKKIKPGNSWEETFEIDGLAPQPVTINGKNYKQYTVYQSAFFPFGPGKIDLPKVDMKLIKYNVAKNPTFYGRNKQEEFVTFSTKPRQVIVKELPDHPLKDQVSVGNYRLDEKISNKSLETGQSFNYQYAIIGEGNISAIKELEIESNADFDLYPPNVRQDIGRSNGKVRGGKSFSFYGVPNEPGKFDLGEYFQWIFFNTQTEKYDTLRSTIEVIVTGESKKNEYILSSNVGSFYDNISSSDNSLFHVNNRRQQKTIINIVTFALMALVIALLFKKFPH